MAIEENFYRYRKLSLKYHPQKDKSLEAVENFQKISEAYDVLSEPKRRAVYDQYGESGLKKGIPLGKGEFIDPYVFHGNAQLVFREFFGTDNPFADLFRGIQTDLTKVFGGKSGTALKKQDPPIIRELYLTLEEIFYGGIKKVKISRRVMQEEQNTTTIMDKILTIHVRKGWREGTRIIFREEGDQGPNTIPADIIFITKDKPHHMFKRDGDNLIMTQEVSIGLALIGCHVDVNTIDGRKLVIPINDIIRPGYQKIVLGEGLPISKVSGNKKGNLIIEFIIIYPEILQAEQKKLIQQALMR